MSQLSPIVKSHQDPRHLRRIKNMQAIFALNYGNLNPSTPDSAKIIANLKTIDNLIKTNAPKWPIDKINRVDLAILRCAVWELRFQTKTPPKVVIDEAVELASDPA